VTIIRPDLLPDGEVILDPEVLFHLAFEDLLRLAHAIAGQVFALGHHADADHVVVLRDVPEPALLRDVATVVWPSSMPGSRFEPL
jgi:hypothetical protein